MTDTVTVRTTIVQSTSVTAAPSKNGAGSDAAGKTGPGGDATGSAETTPQTTIVQTTTVSGEPAQPGPTEDQPDEVCAGTRQTRACARRSHLVRGSSPRRPRRRAPVAASASDAGAHADAVPAGPQLPPLSATLSRLKAKAVNSLIDLFPVPPFLLPIYQAAGDDYGVPWPVLAAINEIETDYGRNLSISSAGAVGWMQFMPSTWARYGVDADGRGTANPYDPIDAIFAAARYLHAAGADAQPPGAIFAYNHADWYVNSVQLRATLLRYLPAEPGRRACRVDAGELPDRRPPRSVRR